MDRRQQGSIMTGDEVMAAGKDGEETDIPARIRKIYDRNCFMHDFFHVKIDEIRCGHVTVSLQTDPKKHANHRGLVHGGVLAALADSVTGVTGATVGAAVVTVSMTMNFIRNTRPGETISVSSRIVHRGRTTMVIEASMKDEEGRLMAEMMSTMMIVGHFPDIPETWPPAETIEKKRSEIID